MNINQQMTNYLEEIGAEVHIKRNTRVTKCEGFPEGSSHYDVVVSNALGESFETVYSQGPAIKKEPNVCDVLFAIASDYSFVELSFEGFCSELGYSEDSRKAYKIWEQLNVSNEGIANVLSGDIIDSINTMLQDY